MVSSFNARVDHHTNALIVANEDLAKQQELSNFISMKQEEAHTSHLLTRAKELANGLQGLMVHYDDLVLLGTLLLLDEKGQQQELVLRQRECPQFIRGILTFLQGVKEQERSPLVEEFQKILADRLR